MQPSALPLPSPRPVARFQGLPAQAIVFWQAHRAELILTGFLFAAGLAMRLPNLMLVPRYSDEGLEVLWGLDIALGKQLPLTATDPYYGPLFAYLVAALFRLFGISIFIPRLLAAVSGTLTVVATYWLARVMWNRAAGILAASLTLVAPVLVVISSHQGWSASLTPFLSTVTLAALYLGVTRKNSAWLASSGFLAAMTLQSHPVTIVALVGMALWFLLRRDLRSWLRQPAPYLALALFLLGYAPMVVANARLQSPMLQAAGRRGYAFAPTLDPGEYVRRVGELLQRMLLLIGGELAQTPALLTDSDIVQMPWLLIGSMGVLAIAGLVLAWRRGNGLLLSVVVSSLVLMPTFNSNYTLNATRYVVYLAPIAFTAIGGLGAVVLDALNSPRVQFANLPPAVRAGILASGLLLLLGLIVYPVKVISADYNAVLKRGETNADFFELESVLRANHACGKGLFQEDIGEFTPSNTHAKFTEGTINYILTLDACRHRLDTKGKILSRLEKDKGARWLIAPASDLATYAGSLQLEPVMTVQVYKNANPGPFVLYHIKDVDNSSQK